MVQDVGIKGEYRHEKRCYHRNQAENAIDGINGSICADPLKQAREESVFLGVRGAAESHRRLLSQKNPPMKNSEGITS